MRILIVAASLATSLGLKAVTSMSTSGGALSHHGQPKRQASNCKDVTFTVFATAQNQVVANPPPNFLDPDTSLAFLTQPVVLTTVSGTQKLYGQYCEPTVRNPKALWSILRANGQEPLASEDSPAPSPWYNLRSYLLGWLRLYSLFASIFLGDLRECPRIPNSCH